MGNRAHITDDTPLRLEKALELAFPTGGMTVSGLRKERDRGTLAVEMIAGKEFTTLADIREMRRKCRERQKDQGSIPSQKGGTRKPAKSLSKPSGSSATETLNEARASALQIAERLQKKQMMPSGNTSPRGGSRLESGTVVQLQSR